MIALLAIPLMALNLGCLGIGGGGSAPSGAASVVGFLATTAVSSGGQVTAFTGAGVGIFVPNVKVWLHDESTGANSPRVLTDLSGRFRFPPRAPGTFKVCWAGGGFAPGCAKSFSLAGVHTYLGSIQIAPPKHGVRTFFGRVRFADGTIPRTFAPMENVNAFVTVRAFDGAGNALGPKANVNNYGDYVLPVAGAVGATKMVAQIEKENTAISVGTGGATLQQIDFNLPNHPPKIVGLVGNTGSGKHWTAAPGDTIAITARVHDDDRDRVDTRWALPDGSSILASAAPGGVMHFTLPPNAGNYEFEAVSYDHRGGYAEDRIFITTSGVRFSGHVGATDAPVVAGAEVQIGSRNTTTNAAGYFSLVVPESGKYVLNIRKHGYQLLSKVYDNSVLGGHWQLTRATITTVDPTQPIDLTNTREPGDCPGALGGRQRQKLPNAKGGCGPGIHVQIPANGLVDENGDKPAGNVEIALATVDVQSPDGMPGDYTVVTGGGDVRAMETFGAGSVEISGGGHTYNLAPGASGEVTIPIPASQLLPPTSVPLNVALLFYDAVQGVWREDGTAHRVGNAYTGTVSHFSTINMDLVKQNQSCVRVDAVGMRSSFDLQVTVPSTGTGPATVKTQTIDNSQKRFHAVFNLPSARTIQLRAFPPGSTASSLPLTLALPGATTGTVLNVDTGAAQTPTTPNQPVFPYTACHGFSGPTPGPLPSAILVEAKLPTDVAKEFLTFFPSGGRVENLTANPGVAKAWTDSADRYYKQIDPLDKRTTLAGFRARNNFASGEVVAAYANSADLGFGREMHCVRHSVSGLAGFDVACYVTNYGNQDTDDLDDFNQALAAKTAGSTGAGAVATVGMEFTRIEDKNDATGTTFVNNTRVVKFYVWVGAGGTPRVQDANLDGYGLRPVPQLCMSCHGDRYSAAVTTGTDGTPQWASVAEVNLGSNFIPFDLRGFTMTPAEETAQQGVFKTLNEEMVLGAQPSQAIRDVISDMYPGGAATQNVNSAVSGWSGSSGSPSQKTMYKDVIAASCRTCHNSQGTIATASSLHWDTAAQVAARKSGIALFVCTTNVMPHALITHRRFWLTPSPYQPVTLADYLTAIGSSATSVAGCRP